MDKPFVLLADDNDATCTLIKALLQREYEVEAVRDGLEAIDQLRTRQYATVILDLRMPQVDGFAVLDHLATEHSDMMRRVIVLTAALSHGELERVRRHDVFAILAKPFEIDVLFDAVRRCAGTQPHGRHAPIISGGCCCCSRRSSGTG